MTGDTTGTEEEGGQGVVAEVVVWSNRIKQLERQFVNYRQLRWKVLKGSQKEKKNLSH